MKTVMFHMADPMPSFTTTDCAGPEPPAVYLCQVSDRVSCGACCGLYNVPGLSRESLTEMLARRTAAFSKIPRTVADIDDFAERAAGFDPPRRPFPEFHHCPFVGLIDGGRRVGCLLHPQAAGNEGVDWRGLSYYGGLACAGYFCPSTRRIPPAHLALFKAAFDDWYEYGLLVTERRLLTAVFALAEDRLGTPLASLTPQEAAAVAALLGRLSALHAQWPFRRPGAPGPANYFFENGEYPRRPVRRCTPEIRPSRYEAVFRELESVFSAPGEQIRAERMIDDLLAPLARVRRPPQPGAAAG